MGKNRFLPEKPWLFYFRLLMAEEKANKEVAVEAAPLPIEFHIEAFWNQYRNVIIFTGVIIIAVAIIAGLTKSRSASREKTSAQMLNQAVDAGNVEAVTSVFETWRGTKAAAQALLLVADMSFQQADYTKSLGLYQRFIREYPQHELVGAAIYGEGSSLQAQGKLDEAIAVFTGLQKNRPDEIWTYHGLLAAALCHELKADPAAARRVYEQILSSQAPDTVKIQAQTGLKRLG
ncbi:tetratricopeptide repeat protein [Kamptonema cortianum]|nr:tetratricopeptide repeat protein [Kamptonema cortianum]